MSDKDGKGISLPLVEINFFFLFDENWDIFWRNNPFIELREIGDLCIFTIGFVKPKNMNLCFVFGF